jgi:hypothetical protein
MKLKYIITNYSPIIFNEAVTHADAAKGLGEIKSAGFVYVSFNLITNKFVCTTFGESISLGIKSNSDDKMKLEKMFNYSL